MDLGQQNIDITTFGVYTDTGFRCDQVVEFAGLRQTQTVHGSPISIWVDDPTGTTEYPPDSSAADQVGSLCPASPSFWEAYSGMEDIGLESVDSRFEDLRGVPSRAVDLGEVMGSLPSLGFAGLEGLTFDSAVLWVADPGGWTSGIDLVMRVDPETAELAFGIPAGEVDGAVVMDMEVRVFSPDDPTLSAPLPDPDGVRVGYGDVTVDGPSLPSLDGASDQAVGMVAPTVVGSDWKGRQHRVGPDGRSKIVVFFAHWCPHCQADVPVLIEAIEGGSLPDDVDLIGVATFSDATRQNWPPEVWLQSEGWSSPLIVDDEASAAAAALGVTGVPFYVVLDGDNVNMGRFAGEIGSDGLDALVAVATGG
jgi:thiol-disulfide isomerase/thioredoxin